MSCENTKFFKARNVPHSRVHRHFYHNPTIGAVRSVSLYKSPKYEDYPERAWPVLFLFHGSGGTDESWFRVGHANVILDNLISEGKAKPMIVVAPFGHTVDRQHDQVLYGMLSIRLGVVQPWSVFSVI